MSFSERFAHAVRHAQSQSHGAVRALRSDLATAAWLVGRCDGWDGVLASKHYDHAAASPVLAGMIERAVSAMSLAELTDSTTYSAVVQTFTQSLASISAFDQLKPSMRQTPLRSRLVAMSGESDSIDGDSTAENSYIPVSSFELELDALAPRIAAALVALSNEAWSYSQSIPFIDAELRLGIARATNRRFLADVSTDAETVAGAGSSAANALTDVNALLGKLDLGATSKPHLIADVNQIKRLALMHINGQKVFPDLDVSGGSIAGVPVIASDQLPSDSTGPRPILLDADAVLYDDLTIELSVARHASIRMTETSGQTGAADMVSLWQTGSRGVRAVRHWSAHVHRADAVVVLTGCGW